MVITVDSQMQKRCFRRATRDGYCYQHHPVTQKKRRARVKEKTDAAYESRRKSLAKMSYAQERLDEIAKLIKNLSDFEEGYTIKKIYQIATSKK